MTLPFAADGEGPSSEAYAEAVRRWREREAPITQQVFDEALAAAIQNPPVEAFRVTREHIRPDRTLVTVEFRGQRTTKFARGVGEIQHAVSEAKKDLAAMERHRAQLIACDNPPHTASIAKLGR